MSQDRSLTARPSKMMNASDAKKLNRIEGVFIQALQPKIKTHEFLDIQKELERNTERQNYEQTSNWWRLRQIVNDVVPIVGFCKQRPANLADELTDEEDVYYSLLHYAAMFQCVHAHAGLLSPARQTHYENRLFYATESLLRRLLVVGGINFTDKRIIALYEDLQVCAPEALRQILRALAEAQPVQPPRSLRMLLSSRWHRLREKSP